MRDALLLLFISGTLLAAIRYPYAGVLVWAWFTLAAPHQAAYSAGTLPLNVGIAAIALGSLVYHGDIFRPRISWQLLFIIAFTLWLFVVQLFSLAPELSSPIHDRFWKVMVFVILVSIATTDRLRFTAILWVLILVMGFYGAKGGLYTLVTLGQGMYFGPQDTVIGDNNHIGIAMAATLPIMIFAALNASNRLVRRGTWFIFALTVIAVIGTYSRGGFISLVVFGGLLWIYSRRKIMIGLAAIVVAIGIFATAPGAWVDRMGTISAADEDRSFNARIDAWVINWELALENPMTGAGLRTSYVEEISSRVSDRVPRAAHSIYFEILGGTGFVGLILYLGIYAFGVLSALRVSVNKKLKPWRRDFGRYAAMSLMVFGVGGASVSMEMWHGYLIILVLANAIAKLPEKAQALDPLAQSPAEKIRARLAKA